jgi:hypothetical protein
MEVVGKLNNSDTTKVGSTGGFKKRTIVVTTNEQYLTDIQIILFKINAIY